MKYLLYVSLCVSVISMNNFHSFLDCKFDIELVDHVDSEPSEYIQIEISNSNAISYLRLLDKISHSCKFHSSFELDVPIPPPES